MLAIRRPTYGWRGLRARDRAGSFEEEIQGAMVLWQTVGQSVDRRAIQAAAIGAGEEVSLVLAGVHGNEPVGVHVVRALVELLSGEPHWCECSKVILLPEINPDGVLRETRGNANGVDLNRNFPTLDWVSAAREGRYYSGPSAASEPETRAVLHVLEKFRPAKIITIHAPLHQINYDGPAQNLAREMAHFNGYPVRPDIGYPTPGSLGTFAGRERRIATVTLELPPVSNEDAWLQNRDALLAAIRFPARLCR